MEDKIDETREKLHEMVERYKALIKQEKKLRSTLSKTVKKISKDIMGSVSLDRLSSVIIEVEDIKNRLEAHIAKKEKLFQEMTPLLAQYGIEIVFEPDKNLPPAGSGSADDDDEDDLPPAGSDGDIENE